MKEITGHTLFAVVRIFVGISMAFAHGVGKVPPTEGLIGAIGSFGFPLPLILAWAVGLIELIGGIFIAMGLFTRVMGGLWVCVMGGAAFVVHAADPFAKKEMALLYLAFALLYLAQGGGRYAVDSWIARKRA